MPTDIPKRIKPRVVFISFIYSIIFLLLFYNSLQAQEYRYHRRSSKKYKPAQAHRQPSPNGITTNQEKATLYGKIIDEQTGDLLQGVTVLVPGTRLGALSNIDGIYRIHDLPTGTYTVEFQMIGYAPKHITELKITEGKSYQLNITLSDESVKLETVVIQDRLDASSSAAMNAILLHAIQVNSGYAGDRILTETPDLQFSTALRRMPGVALVEDRFLSVRGMFERYNSIMINGGLIPFSDFERSGFDFTIVPTNLIESVRIVKSATEDMYNGFSGGIVYITTSTIPPQKSLQVNFQTSYNTRTTFQDFYSYPFREPTGYNFFKSTEGLPKNFPTAYELSKYNYAAPERYAAARVFNTQHYTTTPYTAPMDYNLTATYKQGFKVGKDKYAGVSVGLNMNDRYTNTERWNRILATYDTLLAYCPVQDSNHTPVQSLRQQNFSFLANTALEYPKGKIALNNTFILNNVQTSGVQYGLADGIYYIFPYARLTQTQVWASQLQGEHLFNPKNDLRAEWNACMSTLWNTDPGYKGINYIYEGEDTPDNSMYVYDPSISPFNTRFVSQHNITQWNAQVKISRSLTNKAHTQNKIALGLFLFRRDANFQSRILGFTYTDSTGLAEGYETILPESIQFYPQIDSLLLPAHFGPGGHTLFDLITGAHNYKGQRITVAPFASLDLKLKKRWRLHFGIRLETTRNQIDTLAVTNDMGYQNLLAHSETFPLFFFSSIYSLNATTNLRAVYNSNLVYPTDRDYTPLAFLDYANNILTIGNPKLNVIKIHNLEFRYEHYPSGKETIALSVFSKIFIDPIEQILTIGKFVAFNSAANLYETTSTPIGLVGGLEIETWINLGKRLKVNELSNFSLFLNATLTRSKAENTFSVSNFFQGGRRLQGQAGYILNTGLLYNHSQTGISGGLFYNRTGERIAYVGAGDKVFPSMWELPRDVFDIQVAKTFKKNWEIRLSIIDIFNQPRRVAIMYDGRTQFEPDKDELIFNVVGGVQFNIGFNYKF